MNARLIDANKALNEGNVSQYELLAQSKTSNNILSSTMEKEKVRQSIINDMISDSEIGHEAGFRDDIEPYADDKFEDDDEDF